MSLDQELLLGSLRPVPPLAVDVALYVLPPQLTSTVPSEEMVASWQRLYPLLLVPCDQMSVCAFCVHLQLVQQQVLLTMLLVLPMVRHGQQPYQLLVQTKSYSYGDEQAARPASLTAMLRPRQTQAVGLLARVG